jgi:hypothetical protein
MLRTVECCQMAARLGGKMADQGSGAAMPEADAGATGTSDHALLPPIGHTGDDTGAYSCRRGSFIPLSLAG